MEPFREKELVRAAQGVDLDAFGELVAGCRDSILSEHIGGRFQPVEEAMEGSSMEVIDSGGLEGL